MGIDTGLFRRLLARATTGAGSRNYYAEFGYPEQITLEDYWRLYQRDGLAKRVVNAPAAACWRGSVVVRDEAGASGKPGADDYSALVDQWESLDTQIGVQSYFSRVDRLARVGHFGILVLGFADGQPLSTPQSGRAALAYMAPYAEQSVVVEQWDSSESSPRYGLPEIYRVQTMPLDGTVNQATMRRSFRVHHSRVIHVAEDAGESDVFGTPALKAIWNYLLDYQKVAGASAETFWLNARGGMVIEAAPDAILTDDDIAAMKAQAAEYESQMRRIMALRGAKVQLLTATIADARFTLEPLFALIAGATGIPQRILMGSERGELASSQDESAWHQRVQERREQHCASAIVLPFVRRMIETGNLPAPEGDVWIDWPSLSAASPEKEADTAVKRTTALVAYANSMADRIVPPAEFRPWIGLTPEPDHDMDGNEPSDADTLDAERD